ncbi:MAG: hypothetical protein ABSE73_04460 [Planctomycetota bacterium]
MREESQLALDNEELRRLRRVRQELFARFKTPDELFAWVRQREKEGGHRRWARMGKAQAGKRIKPATRNGKPANGKPVHKV